MSGWWQSNRRALLALIVLVPVTVGVFTGWEWWKVAGYAPTFPTVAEQGGSTDFAGITFGPATATEVSLPDEDLPEGTKILWVRVPLDRHGAATGCLVNGLRELSGQGRFWEQDSATVTWDSRRYTFCPTDRAADLFPKGPFQIDVPFIVPDDVEGPLGVELVIPDEFPGYVRLVVVP
ncbi:hypothetical protein MMM2322_01969 [Microbacterium sp. MM2322]